MFQVDPTKRYALLISGGVDSAVACHLLCEAGIRPDLYYIKIGMQGEGTSCSAEEDIELSTLTAHQYGLSLQVVDLQQTYHDRVTAYVVDRIRRASRPIPMSCATASSNLVHSTSTLATPTTSLPRGTTHKPSATNRAISGCPPRLTLSSTILTSSPIFRTFKSKNSVS